jgi:hypothetical protein
MVRRGGYEARWKDRLRLPILSLILMGLAAYIRNHMRRHKLLSASHDIPQKDEHRDENERLEADAWLEKRLREEVRRYEDDLRELAKT